MSGGHLRCPRETTKEGKEKAVNSVLNNRENQTKKAAEDKEKTMRKYKNSLPEIKDFSKKEIQDSIDCVVNAIAQVSK